MGPNQAEMLGFGKTYGSLSKGYVADFNVVDEKGNVTVGTAPTLNLGENWQPLDGYYYYKGIVPPKESTTSLGSIGFTNAEVNILAESIQVLGGVTGDGNASVDAWKASFDSSTATWTKKA